MRKIKADLISAVTSELAQKANFALRPDVLSALRRALRREGHKPEGDGAASDSRSHKTASGLGNRKPNHGPLTREILKAIIANAEIARKERLAICQDTGMAVVFAEIGQEVLVSGGLLSQAINRGIYSGYKDGCLRNSIVAHPLLRGASDFGPAVIHTEIVSGDKLKLSVLPKGFGCENKGAVKMFNPTVDIEQIRGFVLETVKNAGPDACPPFVLGVGIGGTQDYACLLAKKALLRPIVPRQSSLVRGGIRILANELLKGINRLNIGPMGLGGRTTCLGVNIETCPTHIAGLPVAVNISCHALRSASKTI